MLLLIQGDLHLIIVDPVASDLAKAGPLLHVITSPSDSAKIHFLQIIWQSQFRLTSLYPPLILPFIFVIRSDGRIHVGLLRIILPFIFVMHSDGRIHVGLLRIILPFIFVMRSNGRIHGRLLRIILPFIFVMRPNGRIHGRLLRIILPFIFVIWSDGRIHVGLLRNILPFIFVMRSDGRIHVWLLHIILPFIFVTRSDGRISGHLRAMSNHNSAIQLPFLCKRQNPVSQLLQISLHTLQGIYLLILPGRKAQLKKERGYRSFAPGNNPTSQTCNCK